MQTTLHCCCRTRRYARLHCRLPVQAAVLASVVLHLRLHRRALTQPDQSTIRSRRSVKHAIAAVPPGCVISAECSASMTMYVNNNCLFCAPNKRQTKRAAY